MKKYILLFVCLTQVLFANPYRVLGLGSPCMDYIVHVSEEDLANLGLEKGGWQTVDCETITTFLDAQDAKNIFTGDCTSNTIKGLSSLGVKCALTGTVANDGAGKQIRQIFSDLGVKILFTEATAPTSQIASLITEDGARSFLAFTQAEKEVSSAHLDPKQFEGVELVHMEGFHLYNGDYLEKAMAMSQACGAVVSINLANASVIKKFRERIFALLETYTHLVFVNEEEAYALTHLPPERAAKFLHNFCAIAVVKVGEEGCWVCSEKGLFHEPAPYTEAIDTTGSGDLFASAFIYGYLNKYSLEKCAKLGNLAGSQAVITLGAELPLEKWKAIRASVSQK